ncbi:MAG: class I poly(R)-hydroxyalkanoic acid synthase [Alphaproteobacteria bacterium]|nr:class I poly(R)-hydroxyalkanoic acid synthase [Alphaproteobacteria bacterium]
MTMPDESLPPSGKKLERSLDAVAALRKAMEQRLVEAKAAQIAPAVPQSPPAAETPAAPVEPIAESAAKEEPAAPVVNAPPAPPPIQPKPEAKTQPAPQSETPISFDPIEWSQIMMRVAKRSQELLQDYAARMKGKPVDTLALSPKPILDALSQLTSRIVEDPEAYTDTQLATWQHYIDLTRATLLRLSGQPAAPIAEAAASDKRFKAKDWQTNWMFDFLKQAYLSTTDEMRRLVQQESAHIEDKTARKIEFYSRLFLDATAPNNFWLTNPEVLRATLDSKGENLIKGMENLLQDLEAGHGMLRIRMSDYNAFAPGGNIACSPGKVVYQNDLMQLIQYAPSTPTVRKTPFLIIPPWINKFYILDLREKNSFIRYLVSQGHTVFCISWVNPTKQHAGVGFEDYMDQGALTALREIKRLTGEEEANVLGYCIGGTLLASTQAYLAAQPTKPADLPTIASSTYLVTMIDFSEPGDLGVFIDEEQIGMLEKRMEQQGYMDAGSMALTFNLLRANDLIWPFVINNYMLGREPFPFDILYWNTDSTNLPAAMQSYYLRNMYLNNKLIEPNALVMKGAPLDLSQISTPSFLLATREDHIAPWTSTYAATHVYKGPVTFVLSGSGHIAGVVNPPEAEKYGYWTNSDLPPDPQDWLKNAAPHKGSWWPEWIKWLDPFAGENIAPREVTEGIEDAPGSYVKVRAV